MDPDQDVMIRPRYEERERLPDEIFPRNGDVGLPVWIVNEPRSDERYVVGYVVKVDGKGRALLRVKIYGGSVQFES